MVKVNFLVNNKIEIIVEDNYYKSNIQDIDEEFIWISIPTNRGEYVPLRIGEIVDCIYYYNEDIYKFRTAVKGRSAKDIPTIQLQIPQKVTKIQRRDYVRIPYLKEIKYINSKDNLIKNISSYKYAEFETGVLVDISGGGMKIKTTGQINIKDYLLLKFNLDGGDDSLSIAQVVRVEKDEQGRLVCGLSFVEIDKLSREKIIKFVFKIMREQMRKI